jgi:hypothetical protein
LPLPFYLSSPNGIGFSPLCFSRRKVPGAPSIAHFCDGWGEYRQPTHNAVAVAVLVVIPEGDLLLLFASAVILTLSCRRESNVFTLAAIFLLPFSAQKSHVKSQTT